MVKCTLLYGNAYRSGKRQFSGGLDAGARFIDRDPQLRDVRWFANPDPRLTAYSPALDEEPPEATAEGATAPGSEYIGTSANRRPGSRGGPSLGPIPTTTRGTRSKALSTPCLCTTRSMAPRPSRLEPASAGFLPGGSNRNINLHS